MKDAKSIINHIVNNPSYKELKNHSECGNFMKLLGKNFNSLIKFCYVKNNILFFALLHPAGLQELKKDSSIKMIRSLLKTYNNFNKNSILSNILDIKFFIVKDLKFKNTKPLKSQILHIEPSCGNFINLAKNKEIYEKFEKIRQIIKVNIKKKEDIYAD